MLEVGEDSLLSQVDRYAFFSGMLRSISTAGIETERIDCLADLQIVILYNEFHSICQVRLEKL